MLTALDPISKAYGKSKYWFLWDALKGYIRYGITPNMYISYEFYKLSSLERKRYWTNRDQHRYESKFNSPEAADSLNRKEVTNRVFRKYVRRDWIYGGDPEVTSRAIEQFLDNHDKVIVKPIGLSSGKGVFSVSKSKEQGIAYIRERLGVGNAEQKEDVYRNLLFEEFVCQHPEMAECNPSSVNTVRIFSLLDRHGRSDIISACIRVGGAGADVDNYHAGGVTYPIDIKSGVVCNYGRNLRGERYLNHPSTGKLMVGFKIPHWEHILETVYDLVRIDPRGRMIAWDLAVMKDGIELIEANYLPDPNIMQIGAGKGLKPHILEYL